MSSIEFFITLIRSIALALALIFVYSYIAPYIARYPARTQAILQGTLFGLLAVIDMVTNAQLAVGFRLDSRNILIAISAIFGGPLPAALTTLIAVVCRALLGGDGTAAGIATAIMTCVLSILFYHRFRQHPPIIGLLLLGLSITIVSLVSIGLLIPVAGWQLVVETAPALLLFTPLGVMLTGSFLMRQQRERDIALALRQERQMLRTLIDNLPDYIFVKDADLRFVISNTAHAQAVNMQVKDLTGKTAAELFPTEMAANFEADDQQVLQSGEALINAERITTDATGSKRVVLTSKVPFKNQEGKIVGLVGISRDITRRKQAEDALNAERNLLRTLIDSIPEYIYIKDTQSRFVVANSMILVSSNMTENEQIVGKTDLDFFPAHIAQAFYQDDQQVVLSGQALINKEEATIDPQTNQKLWFLTTKVPLRDENNTITSFLGISRNITEIKQAADALTAERNLLRTLIDSMPDYIFVKDTQSQFVIANKMLVAASGLTDNDQMVGKTDFDFFPAHIAQAFYEDDQQVFASGNALVNKEEATINLITGEEIWLLTTKVPLKDEQGTVTRLLGISRNITELKQAANQAMELALQKEKIQMLADFIRDASHDLKTPLTVIESSLYLLQRSTDAEKQKRHVDMVKQQVARLAQLIDDLLLAVRLDSGDEFASEKLNLNLLVREVYNEALLLAEKHGLKLTLQADTTIPTVRGDEGKLMQALENLVHNAVNYTPEGGSVTIRTSANDHHAVIEVEDTGIGIAEDELTRIFERFYRADKARSTQTGGTGLGLPIAQKIIETHNGVIEVKSAIGQGSTFRVLLPVDDDTPTESQ